VSDPLAVGRWSELDGAGRERLLSRGQAPFDPELRTSVAEIIEDVRLHGDEAVVRATERFDGCRLSPERLRISEDEIAAAREQTPEPVRRAIEDGIAHSRRFNERVLEHGDWRTEIEPGLTVGEKRTPIASAGLFVPCGKGSFPSVLVQIGTPAVVAGVPDIVVVVPPLPNRDGAVDPAVLVAADKLGIRDVFRANGPAGVAAMALGTETIPRSLKVLGPGSPPVAAAQIECQRHGCVGFMLLGPSESLILADDSADARLIAADLLNESEHGADSAAVLVTDSDKLVQAAQAEIAAQLERLPEPRRGYAATGMAAILVDDLDQAVEVANLYAVEHLQLVVRDEEAILDRLVHAGEILLGQHTPIAAANYVLGVPAALPTGRYARVSGGITAESFTKATSIARASAAAMQRLAPSALALAEHEGFPAHAAALRARMDGGRT
jgi:histidinol dehydrogenase